MTDDKKLWSKPKLPHFASADEAITYYTERGMIRHVQAIKELADAADERQRETLRKASRR